MEADPGGGGAERGTAAAATERWPKEEEEGANDSGGGGLDEKRNLLVFLARRLSPLSRHFDPRCPRVLSRLRKSLASAVYTQKKISFKIIYTPTGRSSHGGARHGRRAPHGQRDEEDDQVQRQERAEDDEETWAPVSYDIRNGRGTKF